MTGRWTRGALLSERSLSSPRRSQPRRPRGSTRAARRREDRERRLHLSEDRRPRGLRPGGVRRVPGRPRLHEGQVRRLHDQSDLRRRRDRYRHGDHRVQEPRRPGHQDHRGHRLVGLALQLGPLAAQNNVLYIAGAAANDGITGLEPEHVPRRPADAAGRARRSEHLPAQVDRQEDRRLRGGHRLRRRGTSRPST